jgi:hypothetical protein
MVMKLINCTLHSQEKIQKNLTFIFASPLLSLRSFKKNEQWPVPISFIFFKFVLTLFFLYLLLLMGHLLKNPLEWFEIILLSPLIYFLTESLGLAGQLIFSPWAPPHPIHRHPLLSRSLGDFWGKRWNLWVQDWLRDTSHRYRRFLKRKIFISFLFSGFFHEIMVNLPYFLFYHESYFGNMTSYFMIQAIGLWVEKKILTKTSFLLKRVYLWIFILLPSPLFLAKPLIAFFGLTNE